MQRLTYPWPGYISFFHKKTYFVDDPFAKATFLMLSKDLPQFGSSYKANGPGIVRYCAYVLLLLLLMLNFPIGLHAQLSPATDSVLLALSKAPDNIERVNLLNTAARARLRTQPGIAENFAIEAIELSEKLDYDPGKALAWSNLGNIKLQQGHYDEAGDLFKQGLEIVEKENDRKNIARLVNDMATFYIVTADYDQALRYCERGIKISEEMGDQKGLASVYNRMGIIYDYQGNYLKAIDWYQKSLTIHEELEDLQGMAVSYSNLGIVYDFMKDYEQSLIYGNLCRELMIQVGDSMGLASSYNNLGIIHGKLEHDSLALDLYDKCIALSGKIGKKRTHAMALANKADLLERMEAFEEAIDIARQGMAMYEEINDPSGIAHTQTQLADFLLSRGSAQEALPYAETAYQWSKGVNEKSTLKSASGTLAEIHQSLGNYKQAYEFMVEFKEISDTLLNAETIRKSSQEAFKLQYEKEKTTREMEQKQELAMQDAETDKERLWKYFFIGGFIVLIAFVAIIFWSYHNLRKTNSIISKQKDEIVYLNQNLEKLVASRTVELNERNAKLSEYIFTNSHKVRGPIARILGLLEVRKASSDPTDVEPDQLFSYIEQAATEADRVVNEIAEALEDIPGEGT